MVPWMMISTYDFIECLTHFPLHLCNLDILPLDIIFEMRFQILWFDLTIFMEYM